MYWQFLHGVYFNFTDAASCLFGGEFYDMVKNALKPNGIFLSQSKNFITFISSIIFVCTMYMILGSLDTRPFRYLEKGLRRAQPILTTLASVGQQRNLLS